MKRVLVGLLVVVAVFLAFVALRPSTFHMVGPDFEKGIASLKSLAESRAPAATDSTGAPASL